MIEQGKPRLPEKFFKISNLAALYWLVSILAFTLIPSWINYLLITQINWPLYAEIPLMVIGFFFASQGFHLMGWAGHEGFHFLLHKNRLLSSVFGLLFSAPTVLFLQIGVAIDHYNHHRHTNTEKDPDYRLFAVFKSFWSRLFLTRSFANRIFLKDALQLAKGNPLNMDMQKLPFPLKIYQRLAWLNFFFNFCWLIFYSWLTYKNWLLATTFVFVPLIVANLYSALRPYLEHNNTGTEIHNNARSRTAWFFKWFYFGNSFHLEHHLYPGVPSYRLAKVHRYLQAQGFYQNNAGFTDNAIFKPFKLTRQNYRYGILSSPDNP